MIDVAVVGTGGIAGFHAKALAEYADRARIVAATDVDAAALAAYEAEWSVPAVYPTLDELLAAQRPDLVTLCTPPGLHAAQAVACLSRGVPVLCEKPPVLSLAELDEVAVAATDADFATVFQHRFGSGAARLRGLVGDQRLGRPTAAVCHTLWFRPDDYFAVPWRGNWDVEGGGPPWATASTTSTCCCRSWGSGVRWSPWRPARRSRRPQRTCRARWSRSRTARSRRW